MLKINSKHFIFFIIAVSSISLRTYSSVFIRIGGRDTWISTFIAGLIFVSFFLLICYVSIKKNSFKIEEVFFKVFPTPIAYVLLFILILGFFLICIESACVEVSSIHTNFFLETPIWYCLIFFIVPITYICTKGSKAIAALVLICVISIVFLSLLMFFALFQYKNISYIFPILFNGLSKEFIVSILMILGSFSSVIIVVPFLRYIVDPENLIKYSTVGTVFIFISTSSIVFLLIATFGPLRAGNIFYPEFVQSQRLQIRDFIEFGDFFYILRSIFLFYLKYILAFKGIFILLKNKIHHEKRFTIIFGILIFFISLYIADNQFFLFNLLRYLQLILLVSFFIIPLITYTILFFKKNIKKE